MTSTFARSNINKNPMYEVTLFTNRNLIVFDKYGNQDPLQEAVDCYNINEELLAELLRQPCEFYLARWAEWKHAITQREFEYLLGQRSRDKDIADQVSLEKREIKKF